MRLARKISRSKWAATQQLSIGEIPADAVTLDLKTENNSLSFWQCPTDSDQGVEEVALAIAAAGERVDRLDIIWLADEELREDGLTLVNSEGRTPVSGMSKLHLDVSRLDYVRLGKVARRVVAAIEANRYRRLTRASVKKLIETAVEEGRVECAALCKRLREELANC